MFGRVLTPHVSGPLHARDWEPVTIPLQALSSVEKAEPVVQVHFTLRLRDRRTEYICGCKMDVKSTCIPTWHRMGRVSWSLGLFSQNHLLEVGLTQHRETMALWMFTTVGLFYFIMCECVNRKIIEIAFGWGFGHMWLYTTHNIMVAGLGLLCEWPSISQLRLDGLDLILDPNLNSLLTSRIQLFWKCSPNVHLSYILILGCNINIFPSFLFTTLNMIFSVRYTKYEHCTKYH